MKKKKSKYWYVPYVIVGIAITIFLLGFFIHEKKPEIEAKRNPLTQEEKEFLIEHDKSADKEQIENSIATDEQRELLARYEFAKQYMAGKYTGESFTVQQYPETDSDDVTTFVVLQDAEGASIPYKVSVMKTESGEYEASDNYYVSALVPALGAQMAGLYKQRSAYVESVSVELPDSMRDDNVQAEDIIKGKVNVEITATITLSDHVTKDSFDHEAQLVEKITNVHKLKGHYTVVLPSQADPALNTDTYTFTVE